MQSAVMLRQIICPSVLGSRQ